MHGPLLSFCMCETGVVVKTFLRFGTFLHLGNNFLSILEQETALVGSGCWLGYHVYMVFAVSGIWNLICMNLFLMNIGEKGMKHAMHIWYSLLMVDLYDKELLTLTCNPHLLEDNQVGPRKRELRTHLKCWEMIHKWREQGMELSVVDVSQLATINQHASCLHHLLKPKPLITHLQINLSQLIMLLLSLNHLYQPKTNQLLPPPLPILSFNNHMHQPITNQLLPPTPLVVNHLLLKHFLLKIPQMHRLQLSPNLKQTRSKVVLPRLILLQLRQMLPRN